VIQFTACRLDLLDHCIIDLLSGIHSSKANILCIIFPETAQDGQHAIDLYSAKDSNRNAIFEKGFDVSLTFFEECHELISVHE
jgi:hypothetical protein